MASVAPAFKPQIKPTPNEPLEAPKRKLKQQTVPFSKFEKILTSCLGITLAFVFILIINAKSANLSTSTQLQQMNQNVTELKHQYQENRQSIGEKLSSQNLRAAAKKDGLQLTQDSVEKLTK